MMNFRGLVVTAALALATAGVSSATTIVQSFSLPSGSFTTSWSGTASINQFDTSLGTLEYITVLSSLTDVASAGATDVTGSSTGGDSYTIGAQTTVTLQDPTTALLVSPSSSVSSTYLNQSNGSIMSVTTSGTVNSTAIWAIDNGPNDPFAFCMNVLFQPQGCLAVNTNAGSGTNTPASPLDFGNYFGTGQILLTASASTAGSFGGSSFDHAFATGSASINVSVIYTYTDAPPPSSTPEPAAFALFGSGLVGLGLVRRRFRKA